MGHRPLPPSQRNKANWSGSITEASQKKKNLTMSNPPDIYPTKITFPKCFLPEGTLLSPEKSVLNLSRQNEKSFNITCLPLRCITYNYAFHKQKYQNSQGKSTWASDKYRQLINSYVVSLFFTWREYSQEFPLPLMEPQKWTHWEQNFLIFIS